MLCLNLNPQQVKALDALAAEQASRDQMGKFTLFIQYCQLLTMSLDLSAANRNFHNESLARIHGTHASFFDDPGGGFEDMPLGDGPLNEDLSNDSEWETLHTYMQAIDSIYGPTVVARR